MAQPRKETSRIVKRIFAWTPLAPPHPGTIVPRSAARWSDVIATLFLSLGILQCLLGFDQGDWRFLPLILGMLLFGLPHGAIDHLVALGLANKKLTLLPLSTVVISYLAVVFAVLGLWVIAPIVAAVGFLFITIWHWGKGDLSYESLVLHPHAEFRNPVEIQIHLLLRGLIPIGIPFIAFPEIATAFITTSVAVFSPTSSASSSRDWHPILYSLFISLFLLDCILHLRHRKHSIAWRIILENFCLAAFFCIVSPWIAIGWYFAGWHGFRHILRLSGYQSLSASPPPSTRAKITLTLWQALPFTFLSVFMLIALQFLLADRIINLNHAIAVYLVFISALTLPHIIIVAWMDREESQNPMI